MTRRTVVLYNPKAVFHTMPLSLVAVGSSLDPDRYEVKIIDGRLEENARERVLAEVEDAVCLGVSVLTGAPIHDAVSISRAAKAVRPDLPVIWGGWHPSLFPLETLAEPSVDITVQAQGEETFRELVECLSTDADYSQVRGISTRVNGKPVRNPPRPLIDMNELPEYDYDLIPVERYFQMKGQRQLDYISSTGCFFRCAFCADPFVFNRRWVAFSPERMGDEIERLWHRYRFTELAFQDETFFTYPKRVAAIAEEFLSRDLTFDWTATMRADQANRLSDDLFELCVRSGMRRVMIGVESGSQEMLDWLTKDITIEQIITAAERCKRYDVGAIFPFIVGFPGESDESVRNSLAMVKRLRSMSPRFETPIFYFKPYPGSRITADVVSNGFKLPSSLEEWADFDFIQSSGPWVSSEKQQLIERFKFYNRFAWGPERGPRRALQRVARWRCERDMYKFPIEKAVVERLRPLPQLS